METETNACPAGAYNDDTLDGEQQLFTKPRPVPFSHSIGPSLGGLGAANQEPGRLRAFRCYDDTLSGAHLLAILQQQLLGAVLAAGNGLNEAVVGDRVPAKFGCQLLGDSPNALCGQAVIVEEYATLQCGNESLKPSHQPTDA
eukprot:scaffold527_cov368-Prasinococcus_capsulatus_cf.AAC.54